MEYGMTADDIPDDCVLGRAIVHTDDGTYEVCQSFDGDWVHCLSGVDWVRAEYQSAYVKSMKDGQHPNGEGVYHQWFTTADGVEHDAGRFLDITY